MRAASCLVALLRLHLRLTGRTWIKLLSRLTADNCPVCAPGYASNPPMLSTRPPVDYMCMRADDSMQCTSIFPSARPVKRAVHPIVYSCLLLCRSEMLQRKCDRHVYPTVTGTWRVKTCSSKRYPTQKSSNPILSLARNNAHRLRTCIAPSRFRLLTESRNAAELCARGQLGSSKVLVEIENHLERVAAAQVRQRRCRLLKPDGWLQAGRIMARARHWQSCEHKLVSSQCETELWRRSHDTSGTTLEECLEALLLPDGRRCVS